MKKLLSLLLAITMMASCFAFLPCAGASETENSLPDNAVILVPANATVQETAAAERLNELIEEISGVSHTITSSNTENAYEISVGATGRISTDIGTKSDGSYVIKSYDGGVAIAGSGKRGNIYGVYAFIREFGGGYYYTSEEMYKSQDYITLPQNADIEYEPTFEFTDTDWRSPRDVNYSLANGLNSNWYRQIPEEYGGNVGYIGSTGHTLTNVFCSKEKYFDEHPEYFALHDGVRNSGQLCLTNEDVYEIVKSEVLDLLAREYDSSNGLRIVSLTQYDNTNYCECENCKAIDEANDAHSGTMITFVNRIARAVKEAGYDDVMIDTFAYQYTRAAPTQVVPDDNVIVRFCNLELCYSHKIDSDLCSSNKRVFSDFKDWCAICDNLYVWDYAANYWYTIGIFPDFDVMQHNMQIFAEYGAKGVYEEGVYFLEDCDCEFGELRAYLLSRLLYDPYCDFDEEMNGFLNYYYGDAGSYIGKFIKMYNKCTLLVHNKISTPTDESVILLPAETKIMNTLWEKAENAVADDATKLERVKRSELAWRFVKASVNAGEFSGILAGKEERIKLHDDLLNAVTRRGASDTLDFVDDYMYLPAKSWFDHDLSSTDEFFRKILTWYVKTFDNLFAFRGC